jgi:hypothetical protein
MLTQPTLHPSFGYSVLRDTLYKKLRPCKILLHSAEGLVFEKK